MELNGCRVLVTGASGGIGDALVEQLCKAGAQVLAVGRDADKLAAAQGRFPHALRALVADLATPAGVDAVAAAARSSSSSSRFISVSKKCMCSRSRLPCEFR